MSARNLRSVRFGGWLALHALLAAAPAGASWERGVAALQERDYETAARELDEAARRGDVRAQYALGTLYLHGQGVERDPEQALRWIRRSARGDFAPGQTALGRLYATGEGVAANDEEAVRWYRRAAEAGEADGQAALGIMLRGGRGAEADPVEAAVWLSLARAQGNGVAEKHLAELRETLDAEQWAEVEARVGDFEPRTPRRRRVRGGSGPSPGGPGY